MENTNKKGLSIQLGKEIDGPFFKRREELFNEGKRPQTTSIVNASTQNSTQNKSRINWQNQTLSPQNAMKQNQFSFDNNVQFLNKNIERQKTRNKKNSQLPNSFDRYPLSQRTFNQNDQNIAINALGLYINKQMRSGKGVWIPKFGHFTFTAANIDLSIRDRQERFPVFIVGKDFVSSVNIKPGIQSNFQNDSNKFGMSPFGQLQQNGIIPKVKINYSEISLLTNLQLGKDDCKSQIEQSIQKYSSQVRNGYSIQFQIPQVGTFKVHDGLAGVIFDQQIIDMTKGQTAKNYQHRLVGNNWMNNKIYEPNLSNFGQTVNYDKLRSLASYSQEDGISEHLKFFQDRISSPQTITRSRKNDGVLTPNIVIDGLSQIDKKRTKSVVRIKQNISQIDEKFEKNSVIKSVLSGISIIYSKVPNLAPFQILNIANDINTQRHKIVEIIHQNHQNINLRDKLACSKIHSILSASGCSIQLLFFKSFLKELGFPWNGVCCSFTQLLQKCKDYLNFDEQKQQIIKFDEQVNENFGNDENLIVVKKKQGSQIIDILKDLFYSAGKTLYQIFREYGSDDKVNIKEFKQIVNLYSKNSIFDEEIEQGFITACSQFGNKQHLTSNQFIEVFSISVPQTGSKVSENSILQRVREWMFVQQIQSDKAFDILLRDSNREYEKSLRRYDLHYSFAKNKIGLTAPEVDFYFDMLTLKVVQKEVKLEQWQQLIANDALNPLMIIRQLILALSLTPDDVLTQMKLKIWDEPLIYQKFTICIRRLDPSMSQMQIKALFNKLKNSMDVVEIQFLISNLCGTNNDTVDSRAKMYKLLYQEIYKNNKQKEFLYLLEQDDVHCDGYIKIDQLEKILIQITGGQQSQFTNTQINKFLRQIPKNEKQQISYLFLMDKICKVGNQNHDSFKNLLQKIQFFLEANNLSMRALLKRLEYSENEYLATVTDFAEFIKQKIDKRRSDEDIISECNMIDVDKDGFIGQEDLQTCLQNVQSLSFFENGKISLKTPQFNNKFKFFPQNLSRFLPSKKALVVCKQIRDNLGEQKIGLNRLFGMCDKSNVGMINLSQFIQGITSLMEINTPFLEKLFDYMDEFKIGMVDFKKFEKILMAETSSNIPENIKFIEDSFEWQEKVIKEIKLWIKESKLTSIEAFRSFDHDFDGLIGRDDMKKSLVNFLKIKPENILDTRLDRLFRVFSFYKTDKIQPSDFQRLIEDVHPFVNSASGNTQINFSKTMGGGLKNQSTYDWKLAAIQQLGILISTKYQSIEESFMDASNKKDRVSYYNFVAFITKHDALRGFNLTESLKQKLFAEIDPHKKSFLFIKDWINAFSAFKNHDNIMVEFKNFLQVQFTSSTSAFAFYQSFKNQDEIDFQTFSKVTQSLIKTRELTQQQLKEMFQTIAKDKLKFNQTDFEEEFSNIKFQGKQTIQIKSKLDQKLVQQTDQRQIQNNQQSNWEKEAIQKLKKIIKNSGKSIETIFKNFDVDGSGDITQDEFKKALKMISLGLTDNEIEKIIQRVDANHDGTISYQEFAAKFRDDPVFDQRMKDRCNDKLAELKEKMIYYMTSATDAYRLFDSSRSGQMSYIDFEKLIRQLSFLSKQEVPCYQVIKDLFDVIDTNLDQILDLSEWNQAFGGILKTGARNSVKPTPLTYWEYGLEAQQIGQCLARSRKLLMQQFKANTSSNSENQNLVTFEEAKKSLEKILKEYFGQKKYSLITDDKLACILRVGQNIKKLGIEQPTYDYMKILDVYKQRYQAPQCQ